VTAASVHQSFDDFPRFEVDPRAGTALKPAARSNGGL
jgi:hypothetical protein